MFSRIHYELRDTQSRQKKADRFLPVADWYYYGAAALSSEEVAKDLYTTHYKRYLAANDEVLRMDRDAQLIAAKEFFANLNRDMDDCDRLKSANEQLVNRSLRARDR